MKYRPRGERVSLVVSSMRDNIAMSVRELSEQTGLSVVDVLYVLDNLERKKIVRRAGKAKAYKNRETVWALTKAVLA